MKWAITLRFAQRGRLVQTPKFCKSQGSDTFQYNVIWRKIRYFEMSLTTLWLWPLNIKISAQNMCLIYAFCGLTQSHLGMNVHCSGRELSTRIYYDLLQPTVTGLPIRFIQISWNSYTYISNSIITSILHNGYEN